MLFIEGAFLVIAIIFAVGMVIFLMFAIRDREQ